MTDKEWRDYAARLLGLCGQRDVEQWVKDGEGHGGYGQISLRDLTEELIAWSRGAGLERARIASWLRMPVKIEALPGASSIDPEVLAAFISSIVSGLADVIEQDRHPR